MSPVLMLQPVEALTFQSCVTGGQDWLLLGYWRWESASSRFPRVGRTRGTRHPEGPLVRGRQQVLEPLRARGRVGAKTGVGALAQPPAVGRRELQALLARTEPARQAE